MTLFWVLTALMVAVALMIIAPSLLRPNLRNETTGDTQNAEIARERLAQLEAAHLSQELSDEEFEQAKKEIEAILAEELAAQKTVTLADNRQGVPGLIAIALFLPVLTISLYSMIGTPTAIAPVAATDQLTAPAGHAQNQAAGSQTPSLPDLIDKLAERMKNEPSNADGWFLLGRSQMSLQRYGDAVTSFRRVNELAPDAAPVLLALANAVAMEQGGRIAGEPETLVLRALEKEPDDPVALWLAGNAREEAEDISAAIAFWKRAVPLLNNNPEDQQELISRMRRVANDAGIQLEMAELDSAAKTLTVKISLDETFASAVSPDDTLFVFARALQGPPMPLAAARLRAGALPVVIQLDDTMAMMPAMKLSAFDHVKVSAKISKTGNAMPAADDLVTEEVVAQPGQPGTIEIVISKLRESN